jgi:glycosyltransferase involved in cell wall biosynthesis
MACIVKLPSEKSVGVLSLTTQERNRLVFTDDALRNSIMSLKGRWLIGLHHNWHDYQFKYDPLFDFSMAGEEDLREVNGQHVPLVPMDACNFVPNCFVPGQSEKFWDILYVARAVQFKRIPEFFQCIRSLYDQGHKYRVLFICPVPPYARKERKTVFYDIRNVYDKMFSAEEQSLFTLLTIDYRYPFPFDLPTLSHFYRSSRLFVHTADDERRCRVAAYAWASGIPVVGMDCVAGLLPEIARTSPYFYSVKNYQEFPEKINAAISDLASTTSWDQSLMNRLFAEEQSVDTFHASIARIAVSKNLPYDMSKISRKNLSIRLGRHHLGEDGPNSLGSTLAEFIEFIAKTPSDELEHYIDLPDPERALPCATNTAKKSIFGIFSKR